MPSIRRTASPRTWATSRTRTARSSDASARARSTAARSRRSATGVSRLAGASGPRPRNEAERRAPRLYRLRGYRVLDTNRWIGGNELDVVARRGRTIVFCEVKSKAGAGFGDPLEMVSAEKIRRVRRAAEAWLAA